MKFDEEEKDDAKVSDVAMTGVEFSAIKPGDVSPGGMKMVKDFEMKESFATEADEKKKAMLDQLKKTKELRKNMKR